MNTKKWQNFTLEQVKKEFQVRRGKDFGIPSAAAALGSSGLGTELDGRTVTHPSSMGRTCEKRLQVGLASPAGQRISIPAL